jgi:hypothetical protein
MRAGSSLGDTHPIGHIRNISSDGRAVQFAICIKKDRPFERSGAMM